MKFQKITFNKVEDTKQIFRSSSGGYPVLAEDQEWPTCKICSEKEVLFLQLDITEDSGFPFMPASHFLVFMCPNHNEIPYFSYFEPGSPLPENYWNHTEGHYRLILNPPGVKEKIYPLESHLVYSSMEFKDKEEELDETYGKVTGIPTFKLGGIPSWAQDAEYHYCSCGAKMEFICQVPLDFEFPKRADAKVQPDTSSKDDYVLFLGNEAYFFACAAQCNPLAVWVVVQN